MEALPSAGRRVEADSVGRKKVAPVAVFRVTRHNDGPPGWIEDRRQRTVAHGPRKVADGHRAEVTRVEGGQLRLDRTPLKASMNERVAPDASIER